MPTFVIAGVSEDDGQPIQPVHIPAHVEHITPFTGIQGEFEFSGEHMHDPIEPAIWRFIEIGPRKKLEPFAHSDRSPDAQFDRHLTAAFNVLTRHPDRRAYLVNQIGLDAFYECEKECRRMQQALRRSKPRQALANLRAACQVLADAWRATGRDYSDSDPDRAELECHRFVKLIVARCWSEQVNHLRTILRSI
jgi:hypothetical protein